MKKKNLTYVALAALVIHSFNLQGAAFNDNASLLKKFADSLNDKAEITLDASLIQDGSGARIRSSEPALTLGINALEPITGRTYKSLIQESLYQGKPYELTQIVSFNPTFAPTRPQNHIDLRGVISTFVDEAAFGNNLDTEKTAIDRFGSNLESEQTQKWLIPFVAEERIIADAVLDRKGSWDSGYTPFVPENPSSISRGTIALINPNVQVVQDESQGQVFPYLIDILPIAKIAANQSEIVRTISWDEGTKKATFAFFDGRAYDKLLEAYTNKLREGYSDADLLLNDWSPGQFFKIQRFIIDPRNRTKAYLVDETINEGYYGRGKYHFVDQDFYSNTFARPSIQPDRRAYYVRQPR